MTGIIIDPNWIKLFRGQRLGRNEMGSRLNPERMKMGGLVKHGSLAVAAPTGSTLPSSDCRRDFGVASSNLSCIVSR